MLLEVRNLTLQLQTTFLLKDLFFKIESGKTSVLLGGSGSGKTLCMSSLQGIIPPNLKQISIEILLDNKRLNEKDIFKSRGRLFSSIMQNPRTCFNPLYTIKSHIKETIKALNQVYNTKNIELILDEVGLDANVLNLYPFEISGGMLQRIMIGIALLSKTPFLLADEPTSDLDILIQYKILDILKKLQADKNLGILLITHNLDIALNMADTIYIIDNGRMINTFETYNLSNMQYSNIPIVQTIIDKFRTKELKCF
ncbi:ATP-binding cassette domain-containing protein [Helicobacter sp. MIT 14-3879]|uniref:ATP-binding cassette domain-containing protein n=1 Tax=Helicobacter sp. MIT 14-3879 TaxID=2040649 RepID=UPI000E1EBABF|nr:ATP-binding cassette domain-containing protein [Helicobacter sp. MIT 14-3879]RDU61696.1 nickel import ATP-binding protein NikD [Helicobacter sp. MIT 14-3879]